MSTCHNNPVKSSATKINEHIPCSYSLLLFKRACSKIEEKRNDIINK